MKSKLFAIGLGIALLLPLAVYTGVNIFSPPPDRESYFEQTYDQQRTDTKSKEEKVRIAQLDKQHKKRLDDAEKEYEKRVFYVAFPVGILSIILGSIVAAHTVGAGFMYGGIILLAGGCYSYWDTMTALIRFVSVLVALAVFVGLGWWKVRTAVESPEVKEA
ncbi:MAG: hypothetical protein ABJA67_15365 [Chthonomonadales bacterium]